MTNKYMGLSPKKKSKKDRKFSPRRLSRGFVSPLLTTITFRIYSHQ